MSEATNEPASHDGNVDFGLRPGRAASIIEIMTELAGGIGEGRVLVFQPATPNGGGLEVALGIQRFWQKTLKSAGRPAACILALTRVESIEGTPPDGMPLAVGDKGVALFRDWADPKANAVMVQAQACRWGIVSTFVAAERGGKLATALIEVRDGTAHTITDWTFDAPYVELPQHVTDVLVESARRLGVRAPWSSAPEAFDTTDVGAAMMMLEQMGVLSMAEDGCRLKIDFVLERLGILVGIAAHSRVVVALVPELLGHLARLGAHDLQLGGWMRGVKKTVGTLPRQWDGLLSSISRNRN